MLGRAIQSGKSGEPYPQGPEVRPSVVPSPLSPGIPVAEAADFHGLVVQAGFF